MDKAVYKAIQKAYRNEIMPYSIYIGCICNRILISVIEGTYTGFDYDRVATAYAQDRINAITKYYSRLLNKLREV